MRKQVPSSCQLPFQQAVLCHLTSLWSLCFCKGPRCTYIMHLAPTRIKSPSCLATHTWCIVNQWFNHPSSHVS